ncbi:MAG: BlaI/MecI/CopY family transcriptional regulator [Planctomycetaceae bacterium]|nr:BlaI/MecI/CopY family transcriptional regulator [Planctomycetaceae bacterium]
MSKQKLVLAELSEAQQEIMEIIWEEGELSALELQQILAKRRDVARNTVRTLAERMEEKGWLVHREVGRTFLYSAAIPKTESVGQKIAEVVDKLCGGSPESLVAALLNYRGLDSQELQRIRLLLDEAKATGNGKSNLLSGPGEGSRRPRKRRG